MEDAQEGDVREMERAREMKEVEGWRVAGEWHESFKEMAAQGNG